MPGKIVLLAGRSASTPLVYHALARAFDVTRVILEDPVPALELARRRVRKIGAGRVAGQVAFRAVVMPWLRWRSRRRIREIIERAGLSVAPVPDAVITPVESANSAQTMDLLRQYAPQVVVVNGTRILSKELLQSVRARFVNMHAGITPLYRGVHGAYWARVQQDAENCGVTVHLVDTGIDTGGILAQARIHPEPSDDFATYPYLQLEAGLPLLVASVRRLLAGDVTTLPAPAGKSRLWSHPSLGEYLRHRLRGVR